MNSAKLTRENGTHCETAQLNPVTVIKALAFSTVVVKLVKSSVYA